MYKVKQTFRYELTHPHGTNDSASYDVYEQTVDGCYGRHVATVQPCSDSLEIAKLLAAAPDLAYMLGEVLNHNAATKPTYQLPRSLIRSIKTMLVACGKL